MSLSITIIVLPLNIVLDYETIEYYPKALLNCKCKGCLPVLVPHMTVEVSVVSVLQIAGVSAMSSLVLVDPKCKRKATIKRLIS